MLKKTIQYEDLEGRTVRDEFYFNYTRLEIAEMLELKNLEANIQRLTVTEDAKEAYGIFKEMLLGAYGEKSADGRVFEKSPEIRKRLEFSPALSEMVFEFLEDPALGAQFIEACLPAKMVAEAKAAQAAKGPEHTTQEIRDMVAEADRRNHANGGAADGSSTPVLETAAPVTERSFDQYSDEDLLTMPDEEYNRLVPSQPKDMSKRQMIIGMQRMQQSK